MIQKALPKVSLSRRHLREPNGRFHRLDLAEERANAAELMMAPKFQQFRCFRRDTPVLLIRGAPAVDLLANAADDA